MEKDNTVLQIVTTVWWDLDACPPPKDCDCRMIASCIKLALQGMGFSAYISIYAYGDEDIFNKHALRGLRSSTARFSCTPKGFGASMMKCGLRSWPRGRHPPANHMLITNDFKFYQAEMNAVQEPGCSIFLVYPGGDEVAASAAAFFVPTPRFIWNFSKLLHGGPPNGCEVVTFTDLQEDEMEFPCPNMPMAPSFCYDLNLLCDSNTSVWWDIESCPVPIYCDATVIPDNICTAFGRKRPLTIFTDTSRINSSYMHLVYCKTAFRFVLAKYSSDDMMIAMREWARRNPAPATCLLISGNEIYYSVLDELCSEGYEVLLAHPDGKGEISLASKASCVWEWSDLAHGEGPYRGSISSDDWVYAYETIETEEEEAFSYW